MVLFNHTTRELTAKIVYYGPGLSGKTTNLRALHERLDQSSTGRLLSLATSQDRTIYFDLLPVELGNIKGYSVRFQLCTVPGQVFYNETRKLVLKGVDGIVFVVDSQWAMLSHNLESYQNLRENLREMGLAPESIPIVIQFNKRDLPGVLSIEALQESLGFRELPYVEGVAPEGRGVIETFKLASKLTFIDLVRKLQRPASIEALRSEASATGRGRPGLFPAPAVAEFLAPPPPPPLPPPAAPAHPPSDSPFEMGGEIPTPLADEIFGIPLHVPEAPAPEELLLPEPPPDISEFGSPDRLPAPSNEFTFDLADEPEQAEESVAPRPAEAVEPLPPTVIDGDDEGAEAIDDRDTVEAIEKDAAGATQAAPGIADAAADVRPHEEEEEPAGAVPEPTTPVQADLGPPGPNAPAALDEIALTEAVLPSPAERENPAESTSSDGPRLPAAAAGTTAGASDAQAPRPDYATLERRVTELESRLERVLSALRGALGEPGGPAEEPKSASALDPDESEV